MAVFQMSWYFWRLVGRLDRLWGKMKKKGEGEEGKNTHKHTHIRTHTPGPNNHTDRWPQFPLFQLHLFLLGHI